MKLSNVVDKALGAQNAGIYIPPYVQEVLSAVHDTRSKIERIVPINKERILFDVATIAREDLNKAIRTTITLIEELTQDYNHRYAFSYELDNIEDNDYIVRLKKLLNGFLIYKTHRLFNSWEREAAEEVKKEQITYLNSTRYDGWRDDINKWMEVEYIWATKIEEEQEEQLRQQEQDQYQYLAHTQKPPAYVMNDKNLKENFDHHVIFKALVDMWNYEYALRYCLERLEFFLTPHVKEFEDISHEQMYNPLVLVNAPFIKEWCDNILVLPEKFDIKDTQLITDTIFHLFNIDAKYGQVNGAVKTKLSNIAFQYI